jgi:hypothetical protein
MIAENTYYSNMGISPMPCNICHKLTLGRVYMAQSVRWFFSIPVSWTRFQHTKVVCVSCGAPRFIEG